MKTIATRQSLLAETGNRNPAYFGIAALIGFLSSFLTIAALTPATATRPMRSAN